MNPAPTILAFVAALSLSTHAMASDHLVDVAWLKAHLDDPKLVLLHVGDEAEYKVAHLPGARYVSNGGDAGLAVSDRSGKGLILEMLPPEVLKTRLEGLGIAADSHIVVYFGKDWISPTTRVLFTLDAAGWKAALLDGGQAAWVAAGFPTTAEVRAWQRGSLSELQLRPTVVDAAFVKDHVGKPGFALVDGRSASFYDGVDVGEGPGGPHKKGHIAGAVNLPYDEIVRDDLSLESAADLRAKFERAGVKPGDTVIAYCHIGQQATAVLYAARLLGHPALLYDGSFEDWSRRDGVVQGSETHTMHE